MHCALYYDSKVLQIAPGLLQQRQDDDVPALQHLPQGTLQVAGKNQTPEAAARHQQRRVYGHQVQNMLT